jgi:hypothetical protein
MPAITAQLADRQREERSAEMRSQDRSLAKVRRATPQGRRLALPVVASQGFGFLFKDELACSLC